ncbi:MULTISPECIES: SDR family NAD(P)-dependent oxidoreductase [unclassified Microcoleus]|uniref:SDR family NAD(P)-dependent oxidoreductase n=1 Tax=unclassified Microcoleus TaxID=2642155 RepID=UPI001E14496B|nr:MULTISPECIES: SDR family NAD(P)-dependent oxidoreductase [unclassified Microcoleus]MCC3467274.1 SDR family NAD(P)-dependent oxidoreductase [Microcoleus sp. PH2017_06_SFM_O_A]TAE07763.1 MAG: SDR family NAD(P)-dependent oxidoreductase [Oscillatoriales cyanobacterium]MCC3415079.1 SDR family NAD(P)-dependent oxidoreductase [Microcoleus sp. PH2017_02_FOX_O_A]MCC3437627.1 SDR family NAD(P)-dependent oxidoreductase [Microcoleus sp. PH2017_05_CCC_O_A]MCC3456969.1 SDR family NAD(P)-dependent oxidore
MNKICALVGVGPGLGLALARRFGLEGYQMALLARRPEALTEYTKILSDAGIVSTGFEVDAADSASISAAFTEVQQQIGHPDVLIYNAALLKLDSVMSLTTKDLVQDFKVNAAGAISAIQQVLPGMQQQKSGTILLTGGGLALYPSPQLISLGIGKAAIRYLALGLAEELKADGIHLATVTICGTIAPDTKFDPDAIAQVYWQLHQQTPETWQVEYVYQ